MLATGFEASILAANRDETIDALILLLFWFNKRNAWTSVKQTEVPPHDHRHQLALISDTLSTEPYDRRYFSAPTPRSSESSALQKETT